MALGLPSRENRIATHLTLAEKVRLYELAAACGGETFVEVGSYLGASACVLARCLRNRHPGATLSCVDTWRNDAMTEGARDTYAAFLSNLERYQGIVIPLRGVSREVAAVFPRPVDFLFIDGDHTYGGVKTDVEAWLPLLTAGATVVFHDIGWAEGVARVVRDEIAPRALSEGRLPNLYWARLGPAPHRPVP